MIEKVPKKRKTKKKKKYKQVRPPGWKQVRPEGWKNICRNPGCPEDIWKQLTTRERAAWRPLFKCYNKQINMPPGVHVLDSVVRDLAIQYATLGARILTQLVEEKEAKENKSGSSETSGQQ